MDVVEIIIGDISDIEHQKAVVEQLDLYMQDPMGDQGPISKELSEQVISGLKLQSNYLFFLVRYNGRYAGIANCYINFSTFKAKQYINIHDFAISIKYRRLGLGKKLMNEIIRYAEENGYCKITLEVRDDNKNARELYKSMGFSDCKPVMHYWEKNLK